LSYNFIKTYQERQLNGCNCIDFFVGSEQCRVNR